MNSRDATLARIRAALGGAAPVVAVPRDYRVRGDLEASAVAQLFAQRVAEYCATVHSTALDGLPSLVATILANAGVKRVVVPAGLPADWFSGGVGSVVVCTDDGTMPTWPAQP